MKKIILLGLTLIFLGCQGGDDKTNVELLQDMMEGPQIKTQEGIGDQPSVRVPPTHTIPRGFKPSPVKKNDLATADKLANPLKNLTADQLIHYENVGQEKYQIYCGICHGSEGKGDGTIAPKMLKAPPSLVGDTYKGYTDGRLYYVVTEGWGLMGSYAAQINDINDRWAVVNYVRQLQRLSKGSK